MPFLTICLPVRNSRTFLESRVQSIKSQDFQDWEVVVVDSSSTDGTLEYLRQQLPSQRTRYFQEPVGLYQAWNRCVAEAHGEYIHMATSDDFEGSSFYARLCPLAERHSPDIIYSYLRFVDEAGNLQDSRLSSLPHCLVFGCGVGGLYRKDPVADWLTTLLLGSGPVSFNAALIKRSVLERSSFPQDRGAFGDWAWLLKVIPDVRVFCLEQTLASFRIHSAQASGRTASTAVQLKKLALMNEALEHWLPTHAHHLDPGARTRLERLRVALQKAVANGPANPLWLLRAKPDIPLNYLSRKFSPQSSPFLFYRRLLPKLLGDRKKKETLIPSTKIVA